VRGAQHLYHGLVVQAGEICCASDMTQYEKGIKQAHNVNLIITIFDFLLIKTCNTRS